MPSLPENFKIMAPTRVDLAGGTLDIWPLHSLIGEVRTINLAIDLYAIANFSFASFKRTNIEIRSANEVTSFDKPLSLPECHGLQASLRFPAWVVSQYWAGRGELPQAKISMTVEGQAPLRSGLGGSSALAVAIARGLSRMTGDFIDQGWQWALLNWVKDVEAAFIRTPTGTQDYLAAMFGGMNCFVTGMGSHDREGYADNVVDEINSRLLVLFSGEMHHSGLSNWEIYKGAFEGNQETLKGLTQIRDIARTLHAELSSGNLSWKHIGSCLNEEWETRRQMFHVETPRLEEIVKFLQSQKVFGSKVCGAAQGGSLIALVDPQRRADLVAACESRGIQVLKTSVTRHGVRHLSAS